MAIGSIYRPGIEVARELGVDVDAVVFEQFGISCEALIACETRLSPDQGRALARALLHALPPGMDRCELGLRAAERVVTSDVDLLGYIMNRSAHPLDAARALVQHARLLGDSADFRIETSDERVTLTLALAGGRQFVPEGADFAAAAFFRVIRDWSNGSARPFEVHLPRAKPRNPRLYQRFFGVAVRFDAPAAALVYDLKCMLAPFTQRDRRLAELLSEHASELMQRVPRVQEAAWRDQVRAYIVEGLPRGEWALEHVAWRCGVGERTLRRRLAEAGTSYRALVDDVRKERALAWLDGPGSVSRVAQRLGFSDATAFARAFRRWTGIAPHAHARAQRT